MRWFTNGCFCEFWRYFYGKSKVYQCVSTNCFHSNFKLNVIVLFFDSIDHPLQPIKVMFNFYLMFHKNSEKCLLIPNYIDVFCLTLCLFTSTWASFLGVNNWTEKVIITSIYRLHFRSRFLNVLIRTIWEHAKLVLELLTTIF